MALNAVLAIEYTAAHRDGCFCPSFLSYYQTQSKFDTLSCQQFDKKKRTEHVIFSLERTTLSTKPPLNLQTLDTITSSPWDFRHRYTIPQTSPSS